MKTVTSEYLIIEVVDRNLVLTEEEMKAAREVLAMRAQYFHDWVEQGANTEKNIWHLLPSRSKIKFIRRPIYMY